ncbi:hypothetical protein NLI96_g3164 [Meripilus lineatus]|uniref:Uncharacterized protein n=1 Tax=Meripilus lineatus TaxID=2056292 RepID=A0AAD5V7C2_9APHY|nr:hypothetical protein NLI96_g3164 [Physisporinus lineatus]
MSDVRAPEESGELKEENKEEALKKGGGRSHSSESFCTPDSDGEVHAADSRTSIHLLHRTSLSTPAPPSCRQKERRDNDDDIEMGELVYLWYVRYIMSFYIERN